MNLPIKRSKHLTPLSRDHHAGLLFSWKIRQGIKKQLTHSRLREYVRFFWNNHLEEHFREEEVLLFNQIRDEITDQGCTEHRVLRRLFSDICNEELRDYHQYQVLAETLSDHVRFEERQLFPLLESTLPEQTIMDIGSILLKLHATPFDDNYPDEFWK